MGNDTLSATDNRTGQEFELPIDDGAVRAMEFRQMKVDDDDFGLLSARRSATFFILSKRTGTAA